MESVVMKSTWLDQSLKKLIEVEFFPLEYIYDYQTSYSFKLSVITLHILTHIAYILFSQWDLH